MQQPERGAEPQFTADELENSFPLDQGRRFAQPGGRDLLERVRCMVEAGSRRQRARRPGDEHRYRQTLEALLANIVAAHCNAVDTSRFVAVSLSRDQYNGEELSFQAMRDCCDGLRAAGLVEFAPGFRRVDSFGEGHFGRRSRIRAAPSLRELIDSTDLGKRPLSRPSGELIRINAKREEVGGVPEHIEASRAIIAAVNRRLGNTDIAIGHDALAALRMRYIENEGEDQDARDRKRRYAGDLTATSMYRAFKGDWQSGGRFYGGWWMSFPRAFRPYITINGDPVIELDYKTLHPLLLYRRAGLELDFDPYLVPPWLGQPMRDLGKRTLNRLINRAQPDVAKRLRMTAARGDLEVLPKGIKFANYLNSLIDQLRPIEHWFGSGEGIRLQYADSELALSILTAMETEGVAVLPIHDSFIVASQHEERLRKAMVDAFFSRYNAMPGIDRKGSPGELFRDTGLL